MPSNVNKGGKGSKLSLTKKQKTEKAAPGSTVLPSESRDLNESHEFREPMTFAGSGDSKGNLPDEEPINCQVCGKKIGHMNSQRRTQHVNKCIDEAEAKVELEKKEAVLLETAKTCTLDCPMCGKPFKSDTSRQAHLKRCGQALGVDTGKMLQLVRDQETDRQNMVAANIVPPALRKAEEKQTGLKKKQKVKEPKDQFEEDLQVALAISSSLAKQDSSNVKKGKESKKGKKTASLQDICLLESLSAEEKQRRLEIRVNDVLNQKNADDVSEPPLPLFESQLQATGLYGRSGIGLWQRASLQDGELHKELFYVGKLMPPITFSRPLEHIRRDTSLQKRKASLVQQDTVAHNTTKEDSVLYDEVIAASTQTAAVLAELAVDDSRIDDDSQLELGDLGVPSETSFIDHQPSGFLVEKLTLKDCDRDALCRQTVSDFRRLINQSEYSDVTVASLDCIFHAHRLVLAARCPQLIKHIQDSTIHLEVSAEAAWSLLTFIYAGELTVSHSVKIELLELSEKLELHPLNKACCLLHQDDVETSEINDEEDISESVDINLKEICGVSDSEGDTSTNIDKYTESSEDNLPNFESKTRQDLSAEVFDSEDEKAFDAGFENIQETRYEKFPESSEDESSVIDSPNKQVQDKTCVDTDRLPSSDLPITSKISIRDRSGVDSDRKHKLSDSEIDPGGCQSKRIKLNDTAELSDSDNDEIYTKIEALTDEKDAYDDGNTGTSVIDSSPTSNKNVIKMDASVGSVSMDTSDVDLFGSPSPIITRMAQSKVDVDLTPVSRKKLSHSAEKSSPIYDESDASDKESVSSSTRSGSVSLPSSSTSGSVSMSSKSRSSSVSMSSKSRSCSVSVLPSSRSGSVSGRSSSRSGSVSGRSSSRSGFVSGQFSSRSGSVSMSSSSRSDSVSVRSSSRSSSVRQVREVSNDDDISENIKDDNNVAVSFDTDSENDDLEIIGDNLNEIRKQQESLAQMSPVFSGRSHNKNLSHQASSDEIFTEMDPTSDIDNMGANLDTDADSNVGALEGDHDIQKLDDDPTSDIDNMGANLDTDSNGGALEGDHDIQKLDDDPTSDIDNMGANLDTDSNGGALESDHDIQKLDDDPTSDIDNMGANLDTDADSNGGALEVDHDIQKFDDDLESCFDDSFNALNVQLSETKKKSMLSNPEELKDFDSSTAADTSLNEGVIDFHSDTEVGTEVGTEVARTTDTEVEVTEDVGEVSESNANDDLEFSVWDHDVGCEIVDDPIEGHVQEKGESGSKFRTPHTQANKKGPKKPWMAPSPFTPMPQYDNMATPHLKKAVQGFGVKAVGKKRMLKLLKDIYHNTHQYETDSECEDAYQADSEPTVTDGRTDSSGEEDSSASQEFASSQSMGDLPEESFLYAASGDSDTSSSSSSSPQKGVDLKTKLTDYIVKCPAVYNKVLMYEPLELDVLKADLKTASVKCSKDKLMDFLDEKCIAFTTKNTRKTRTTTRGRRKAPKASQKSPKKPRKTKS